MEMHKVAVQQFRPAGRSEDLMEYAKFGKRFSAKLTDIIRLHRRIFDIFL